MTDSIRAALSQPEPASLSDEKIEAIFDKHGQYVYDSEEDMGAKVIFWGDFKTAAREIESAIAADRAQPEPVPGEVQELVGLIRQIALAWEPDATLLGNMTAGQLARAADLLESLSPPQPVPVSERLPGPEDCDAEGRCWWFCFECPGEHSYWILAKEVYCNPTYWRPASALPLPGEVEHG